MFATLKRIARALEAIKDELAEIAKILADIAKNQ